MFRLGRSITIAAAPLAAVLVACGSAERGDGAEGGPADTLLEPVPSDEQVVGPAPSTTTPSPVDPLSCSEDPVTIAERVLVARRQRAPSPGCSEVGGHVEVADVCWDECADGERFVDFGLDPEAATGSAVPYVALYTTTDGDLVRRAESLLLAGGAGSSSGGAPDEPRRVIGVEAVELSDAVDAARTAVARYLAALSDERFQDAAALLLAERPAAATRDDLGRLVDAGMIPSTEVGPAELADSLARWCTDAACDGPTEVAIEITPTHDVRAIATYAAPIGEFEVVFDAGRDVGGFFVEGLPPVLP